jgi:hypothetical protein
MRRHLPGVVGVLVLAGLLTPVIAQQSGGALPKPSGTVIVETTPFTLNGCLHGDDEPEAQRRRRGLAIAYLRAVVDAQRAFAAGSGRYAQLSELTQLPFFPAGWQVQVTAAPNNYTASVKDNSDACGYGLYADHLGALYSLSPLREQDMK